MLEIGKILTTHGLDGAVKLQSFCEYPESIFSYKLYTLDGKQMSCKKVGLTSKKDTFLAKFNDINSIDEAKNYKNTTLFAKEDEIDNDIDDSMVYISHLINMTVVSGEKIGKIVDFSNYGAGDIIDIQWNNNQTESILFSRDIVKNFDKKNNTITIETPNYI